MAAAVRSCYFSSELYHNLFISAETVTVVIEFKKKVYVSDYANNVSSNIKDNVSSLEERSSQFRYFIINCHELDNKITLSL